MFFRNLTFFRFPAELGTLLPAPSGDELVGLGERIATTPLRPLGPLELSTRGFVPPLGTDSQALAHAVGRAIWITLGGEDKLLPPAVINAELERRLAEAEEREGRRPGGRARKRMKEEIVHEFLPRAFTRPTRTDAYFDLDRCFIAVDTTSRRTAEGVVSAVRQATGTFPALPLNAEVAPRSVLTDWITGAPLPEGLGLGEDCEFRSAGDDGGRVTIRSLELGSEEVTQHLEAGMQCTRLALVLDDHMSFELGEDLVVRKLRFLDGAVDALDGQEHEDVHAELDARFALMAGEVGRLFDVLEQALHLSRADDERPPAATATPRRRMGALQGVETVTISTHGQAPVTLTAEQFAKAPKHMADLRRAAKLVRASGNASISRLQREMKIGYNAAARLLEGLEVIGTVSPPDAEGKRTVIPFPEPGR